MNSSKQSHQETLIVSGPLEVERKLQELGLSTDALTRARIVGERKRMDCHGLYPRNIPGVNAWSETLVALRMGLRPLGWQSVDSFGLAMVRSPDNAVQLMVSGGTEETGMVRGAPRTVSRKGPMVQSQVVANELQLTFADVENDEVLAESFRRLIPDGQPASNLRAIQKAARRGIATWVLLINSSYNPFAKDAGEVEREVVQRAELSLPLPLPTTKRLQRFAVRILLEPIRLNEHTQNLPQREHEEAADIDIEVLRIEEDDRKAN